ncbi:MAG: SURF1 family cytochrome oxidase biogenesis protein [Alteraurantiacibacter sp.]
MIMETQRRIPVIATLVVLVAVAIMIMLGFWQLDRKDQKEALLARFAQAQAMSSDVAWPAAGADTTPVLYRHARVTCAAVLSTRSIAGRSIRDEAGWAHVARCRLAKGGEADVALGWSRDPLSPAWQGGEVGGFIGPAGKGIKLVAAPAQAGLEQLAAPDPNDIPNNHLAYAWQWFIFAATALVIYALALRGRMRKP